MKIRPVGAELFHADGRTDGQTDMTKLIVAFRNFAKQLKKYEDPRTQLKAVLPLAYVSRLTNVYLTLLIITTTATTLPSFIFAKELTYTLYTFKSVTHKTPRFRTVVMQAITNSPTFCILTL